jgi:hypothetical protein
MSDPAQSHPLHPSKKAIVKASTFALVVALVILFVAIFPAEYGIDPTGVGKALGLTALNTPGSGQNLNLTRSEPQKYAENRVVLQIAPLQGFEYKFLMQEGQMLLYSWQATSELEYEFHGQLEDAPQGEFTSYEKKAGTSASGSLVAPFKGIHGWYWENRNGNTVTITLETAGFYTIKGVVGASNSVVVESE